MTAKSIVDSGSYMSEHDYIKKMEKTNMYE